MKRVGLTIFLTSLVWMAATLAVYGIGRATVPAPTPAPAVQTCARWGTSYGQTYCERWH